MLEDDELRKWLGRGEIDEVKESLEISVKYRDLDDLYDSYSDRFSPNYIEDDNERADAREKLLSDNPDYATDRRRRDAYNTGLEGDLIEDYVEWFETSRKGYGDDWWLMEHQDFYDKMTDLYMTTEGAQGLAPRDFSKVPDIKWHSLWEDWVDLDAKYDGAGDIFSEYYIASDDARAKYRKELLANSAYRKVRRKREAIEYGLAEDLLDIYVGFYEVPPKSSDSWYNNHPDEPYYGDDWYLMEHPELQKAMVQLYIDTEGAFGWKQMRDYSKVPSRTVWNLYKTYLGLPKGDARLDFRVQHPDLDAWLVLAKGLKPTGARGEEEAPKTPWEELEEKKRIKEWLESL